MEEAAINAKQSATRITIVIPTLNESEAVGRVVAAVKSAMDGYEHQVLVVDGHSTDGTDKIARDMGATVICQRGRGYGNALKTGFSMIIVRYHFYGINLAGLVFAVRADLSRSTVNFLRVTQRDSCSAELRGEAQRFAE